jgi:hypothetical protein
MFIFDQYAGQRVTSPSGIYAVMDAYAMGTVWDDESVQAALTAGMNDLTPNFKVRGIFNVVRPIVEFYVDYTQQGMLGVEGDSGVDAWFETKNPRIIQPMLDVVEWSSLATESRKLRARAAKFGNVLLVVSDRYDRVNPDHSTVRIEVRHPAELTKWAFDRQGNLTYALLETDERTIDERTGRETAYRYGRLYTRTQYATFKDGQAFAYDDNPTLNGRPLATWPNPHGFVPIRVCQHEETEGEFGANAWYLIVDALNEINLRASQVGGNIGQHFSPAYAMIGVAAPRAPATGEVEDVPRNGFLYMPPNSDAKPLLAQLDIPGAYVHIERILKHIVEVQPELTLPELLKAGGDLTGVAVQKMLTGLRTRGEAAQANYDGELVKALQMALSMGKNVAGSGYDLWAARYGADVGEFKAVRLEDSFDCRIHRPDILPLSELEQLQLLREKATLEAEIAAVSNPQPVTPSAVGQRTEDDPERREVGKVSDAA